MILWKFKEELETRLNFPCEKFRWVIQTGWLFVEINLQFKYKEENIWNDSHTRSYGVNLTRSFELGFDHIYYDGPHCFFSLGFLHFFWGGNPFTGWCKKCMPKSIDSI